MTADDGRPTVLLVGEESPGDSTIASLAMLGLAFVRVTDASGALALASARAPALIVVNVAAGDDGTRAAASLRVHPATRRTPLILHGNERRAAGDAEPPREPHTPLHPRLEEAVELLRRAAEHRGLGRRRLPGILPFA